MRNIEALKNYFLGKDPQLKETMADNSLRLIGIPGREFVLRAEVLQRLKKLRDELTEKDEELQDEIDDLVEDVEALTTWKDNNNFVFDEDLDIELSRYYTKEQVDLLLSVIPLEEDIDATNNMFTLDEGIYYSGSHVVKYLDSSLQTTVAIVPQNALFFYSAAYNTFEILNLTEWGIPDLISYKYVWENNAWKAHIVGTTTTIDSNSTDGEIPTAKAVYDATLDNYSTTEQRVGTWIDGKPLYKKSVNIGVLSNSATTTNYAHNISDIDYIFKTEAVAYAPNYAGHNSFMLPYITGASNYVGMYVDKTNISIVTSSSRTDYNCIVTLYYTKTTD